MKRGSLVTFSGMDGSGKTTLVHGIVSHLTAQGFDPSYVYGRYQPVLLKPLIMFSGHSILREESFYGNYESYSESKKRYSQNHRMLSRIYRMALLSDYYLQLLVKVRIPIVRGRTVICDRYIFDTIATDLAVDFNLSEDEILSYLESLSRIFPKPDVAFLVDLPEDEAMRRKTDVPSVQYLTDRRWVYHLISNPGGLVVLDGLKPPNVLVEEAGKMIRGEMSCQE